MKRPRLDPLRRPVGINRRAFLRGAAGVAIGLPFLEGLPERSAWAQDQSPIFSLFMCAANGVVGNKFFPATQGPITEAALAAASDKATSKLARHAANLLFVRGINYPMNGPTDCGHAQGLCQALTAMPAGGGGKSATSTGPSADVVIAERVMPGADPLTLYAGNKRNGYIVERLSFAAGGAGQVRAADDNPYTLYSRLVGLTTPGGTTTPAGDAMAGELLTTRKSVNDLVRVELNELMGRPQLSAADGQRLQQHFDAIRDAEVTMGGMADAVACSTAGLDVTRLDALRSGLAFQTDGMIEEVVRLHMSVVAVAFGCNFSRTATLQWGDGTDQTKYAVPANASLSWPFHHISHRVQSDSASGTNPTAEQAHAEIDVLRMESLAAGLDHFASRGLQDRTFVMWTNHVSDGPSHSFKDVPVILWGNAGGYLKQGQYVDAAGSGNNKLLNTLISAAIQDTGATVENFGEGAGGQLDAIRA
jgi:hypothetical protein